MLEVTNPALAVARMRREVRIYEPIVQKKTNTSITLKNTLEAVYLREHLPDVFLALPCQAEAHAHGALVAHVRRPAACPLCLHVCDPTRDTVIATIDEQGNTNVNDLGYERVFLAIGSMLLYLR